MISNIKASNFKAMVTKQTAKIYYEDSISRIRNSRAPFIHCSTLVDIGVQINYDDNLRYRDLLKNNNYLSFSSYIFTVMVFKAINA